MSDDPMPPVCTCTFGSPDPNCPGNADGGETYDRIRVMLEVASSESLRGLALELLAEHRPAAKRAWHINSLDCVHHDPRQYPEVLRAAFDTQVLKDCPTCETWEYVVCSSRSCAHCGSWPCPTVRMIEKWMGVT